MIIKGGYLKDTNSTRIHPIKNVIIKKSQTWSRITVKSLNDSVTVCNIGIDYIIKTVADKNYIVLVINEKEYFKQLTLFEFEIEIDTEDISIVEFKESFIYDS
jgi:hypothetical protein